LDLSVRFGAAGEAELQVLWEDGERVFCRGWCLDAGGNRRAVLAVVPAGEHPSPATLDRLAHEYGLRDDLEAAGAVRPLEIVRDRGRAMLVLEDPGGEPLERVLHAPMELGSFLRLAIGITIALRKVHQRGLVHKDIKPANILLTGANGEVRLTGFGIALRLPREWRSPEPLEFIAGALAYMSPEQTGRMNRSIDSRSDLYSLGVTLYQMLTGSLPFTASDPMEWVHCHIARKPPPPGERLNNIPPPVDAIIMKLLAKTADERYQTAAGVESDLRRCLADWDTIGRIDEFPPGQHDTSDRLLIPEKLYGRAAEIDTLLASFDRVVATGAPELVLVSGYSGIGKSSVVSELHKALVPPRGLFAAGKFDQYKRDIPYATLAQALRTLVHQILVKSEAEVDRWRRALREAVEPNGQLIAGLVPEVEFIIGKQPPVPDLPPRDALNRFQLVFRRFLDVFATPEHPLALFLDDLQWLDAATLALLEHLVTHPDVRHLLLVGAYRDNEVSPSHPLLRTLQAIRRSGAWVQEIVLAPLKLEDIGQLVADAMHCPSERVRPLAQLVHEKTGGNPFFGIQFFTALAEEGLLTFDADGAVWRWNLDGICAKDITDNVVELMAEKVRRLPDPALRVLREFACLGTVARAATLSKFLETSEDDMHAALLHVIHSGLVILRDGAYAFVHDRVQEAVYALIPEDERAAAHLRIGRVLASHTEPAASEETIFETVNHLNRGAAVIGSPAERGRVAAFNLLAGKRAKASTAYASALTYFTAGRMLVVDDWELNHGLLFDLELHCAECEFLTGELATAEQRLSVLSEHVARLVDRAAVTCLLVALYTTLDRFDRAIEVGLAYLRHAGVEWSRDPTDEDVRDEYGRMQRLLAQRPLEQVLVSPLMSDADSSATMNVLADLMPPLLFAARNLHDLALLRMTNISLEHGSSDGSCYAYARLMQVLGVRFADYETAFRFGQLACDLVDRRGLDRFKARVYMCFGSYVICWFQHLATSRVWITRAFDAASANGDLTFTLYACKHLTTSLLVAGEPLPDVELEIERGLVLAQKARFGLVIDAFIGQLMMIRALRGLPPDIVTQGDETYYEGRFEQHLAQSPHLALPACWYWIYKLQSCFFAGDHVGGLAAAAEAAGLLWSSRAYLEVAEYHLYAALIRAAACDALPADSRLPQMEALLEHHRQIMAWAANCPANFENRGALVGAEIARLQGHELDAQRLYEQAIVSAREHGFIQNEGVSHELAGRFYAARGFEAIADLYLRNARSCYLRWGAEGKVRQLDRLHPHLAAAEGHGRTAIIGSPVQQLDVASVVKASQAVSSEIVLPKLIERLMTIALENAGADRGLLILPAEADYLIRAEAKATGDQIGVVLCQKPISKIACPESLVRYVIRALESVILDDASRPTLFSADEYLRSRKARSILCLPLIKQGRLTGLLYLENTLTSHAFPPDRIALLELLAAQAAISLENTRLYSELEEREAKIRRLFDSNIIGTVIFDLEERLIDANDAFLDMVGYDRDDLVSGRMRWPDMTPAEWRPAGERTAAADLRAIATRQAFEMEYFRKDGSRVPVLVGAAALEGTREESVAFVLDLSDRKQAEAAARELQLELAHANRIATMGQITAAIAHEVKQPITATTVNAAAASRWLDAQPPNLKEARQALARIVETSRRASNVVDRIHALIRKAPPRRDRLDINEVICDVIELARGEAVKAGVSVQTDLADGLPSVYGDRVQLQQVNLNLIINAIEAMSGIVAGPRELLVTTGPAEPGGVFVAVRDSGPGLAPETLEHLFNPFYTTKPAGLGMGLSICRSIIDAHGGRLWAEVAEPCGAVFQFTLSAHRDNAT
jgi:PAS domain S-box-containing protein